jgi:hypothetical protein
LHDVQVVTDQHQLTWADCSVQAPAALVCTSVTAAGGQRGDRLSSPIAASQVLAAGEHHNVVGADLAEDQSAGVACDTEHRKRAAAHTEA